mmetsp:Transcript_42936/g.43675  ORF Transcript_42936/g.43675 Transcript_42936/m.43675 type:complete len:87 (+) Transcript_42936:232-492(+)
MPLVNCLHAAPIADAATDTDTETMEFETTPDTTHDTEVLLLILPRTVDSRRWWRSHQDHQDARCTSTALPMSIRIMLQHLAGSDVM